MLCKHGRVVIDVIDENHQTRHGRARLNRCEKNHVVPTAWQDEALARDGVSREVPCSALKGVTPLPVVRGVETGEAFVEGCLLSCVSTSGVCHVHWASSCMVFQQNFLFDYCNFLCNAAKLRDAGEAEVVADGST